MKKLITAIVILMFISPLIAQSFTDSVKQIIDDIQKKYAPDRRVALFNVEVGQGNDQQITLTGETDMSEAKEELMAQLEKKQIPFEESIKVLPDENLGEKIYGLVNLSVANIRSKPNHPAELATQALMGTPVKVLKYDDGFYLIQTPDGYLSWVDNAGIVRISKDELNEWLSATRMMYLNEYGWAYSKEDVNSTKVTDLVMGDIFVKIEESGDYVKVKLPDGREAFVDKRFVINYSNWLDTVEPTNEKIIGTAERLMGVPYLWGGTSSKGVDCSGFTKTVYFMNGIVLPRDASQQVHTGELVDTENGFDNLQPGDLLFFGRKATEERKERITHVAIYIGNMEYIHSSGRVKINSFDKTKKNYNEYRMNSFIRAKRILTSIGENGIELVKNHKFYNGDF